MRMSMAASCWLLLCGGILSVDAEESTGWPHWRGPTFDAVSPATDLANSWPVEGPPVLWSREIGAGYSGFVAIGNRVFTQTQTTFSQFVICMNVETGDEIWRHRYALPYDGSGVYPGPRATPTLYRGKVYFAAPVAKSDVSTLPTGH